MPTVTLSVLVNANYDQLTWLTVDLDDRDLVELPSVFAARTAVKYSGPRENFSGTVQPAKLRAYNHDEE